MTYWEWQTPDGSWNKFRIYPVVYTYSIIGSGNYIAVRRNITGTCDAIYHGQTEKDIGQRWYTGHRVEGKLDKALKLGFNELHVLRTGYSSEQRLNFETQMRRAHPAILNRQDFPQTKRLAYRYGAQRLTRNRLFPPNALAGWK